MAYCYILYSKRVDKHYIGACSTSVEERLNKHNTHFYGKTHYTASSDDWELYLSIELDHFDHALRLERKIKDMKSRKYIKNLKKYSALVLKIIQETST